MAGERSWRRKQRNKENKERGAIAVAEGQREVKGRSKTQYKNKGKENVKWGRKVSQVNIVEVGVVEMEECWKGFSLFEIGKRESVSGGNT